MRLAAALPGLTLACAACHQHVNPEPFHVLAPPSLELSPTQVVPVTRTERTLSRAATGDTSEHESVVALVGEDRVSTENGDTFVRVTAGHYAGGDYYDSLFIRYDDLRPIREHLAYLQRHIDSRFDFHGNVVRRTNTTRDSTWSIDKEFVRPVYAFSEIDVIIRALPLRTGYSAILPLYSEGDSDIEMDSVSVQTDGPAHWAVRFADPAVIARYGVDAVSRRIVSYEVISRKTAGRARKTYAPPEPNAR